MMRAEYHGSIRTGIIPLVPSGERLLDVGGGLGATAAELKRLGRCRLAGVVDLVAPDRAEGLDFSCRSDIAFPGAIAEIAARHGPFDTVLCLDVLEHLIEPEKLLAEVFQSLRPGGCLVASIPNVRHFSVVWPLLRGRWDYAETGVLDRTHLRFYTRNSASALIAGAGFRIDRVQPTSTETRWQRLSNALTLGLLRDFFARQYFFVAHS